MRRVVLALCLGIAGLQRMQAAPGAPIYPFPPHQSSNAPSRITLTWSPGDEELFVNGDFETGTTGGWTHLNSTQEQNSNTYINNGSRDPQSPDPALPPFAGNYSVVTDPYGPGLISIYQEFTVPAYAQTAILTWADRVRNQFDSYFNIPDPNPQEYRVEIRTPNNVTLATPFRTEPGDPLWIPWTKRSFDMSPFVGQRVRVVFQTVQTRFFFNAHLDNVSLRVISGVSPFYDVFFGTNSTLGTNDLLLTTTNRSAALPSLFPGQTWFWRVNTRLGTNQTIGPVWRFSTATQGTAARLNFGQLAGEQSQPLRISISAVDKFLNNVPSYNRQAGLAAYQISGVTQGALLADPEPLTSVTSSRSTVGYSFRASSDLLVSRVRHFAGEKISLWSDDGLLLAAVQVTNAPGTWTETALQQPVQLYAGQKYRLGVYSSALLATNYADLNASASFPHGELLQSYEGAGDAMPGTEHLARWWLVDAIYTVRTLTPISVSPSVLTFTNGGWTGNISVAATSGPVILGLQDNLGIRALSSPFVLIKDSDQDGMPDDWEDQFELDKNNPSDGAFDMDTDGSSNRDEYSAGTDPRNADSVLRIDRLERSGLNATVYFPTVAGKTYRLQSSPNLTTWITLSPQVIGDGNQTSINDVAPAVGRFYRLVLGQ